MTNIIDLLRPGQDIKFDNGASGLTATNLNAAINEVEGRVDTLETNSTAVLDDVANLVTLTGVAVDSVNLGTFTGGVISDNVTIKAALQELETYTEGTVSKAGDTMTGALLLADGSASAPSLSFASDTDSGLFNAEGSMFLQKDGLTGDFIAFDGGGVLRVGGRFEDLRVASGSVTGPSLRVGNEDGFYAPAAGEVALSLTDTLAVNFTSTGITSNLSADFGTNSVKSSFVPAAADDLANKLYVDNLSAGVSTKDNAVVATTANIDLTTGGLLTIDGVTLTAGQRVLVKDQTTASENGIYDAAAGAWSRSDDSDGSPSSEIKGGNIVFVDQGTANADTVFVLNADGEVTVDVGDQNWIVYSRAESIQAGNGIDKTGLVISLASSVAGDGLTHTTGVLSVNVDDSTVELSGGNLQVKDLGITTAKLAAASVTTAKLGADVTGTTGAASIGFDQTTSGSGETTVQAELDDHHARIAAVEGITGGWTVVTGAVTMANAGQYAVDTTSAAVTVTLPATPTAGDSVRVFDAGRAVATNAITVARNGSNIQGVADDVVNSSIEGADNTYVFIGGSIGWAISNG